MSEPDRGTIWKKDKLKKAKSLRATPKSWPRKQHNRKPKKISKPLVESKLVLREGNLALYLQLRVRLAPQQLKRRRKVMKK